MAKNKTTNNQSMNPVAAGAIGAVVGAAVGIAAGVLADEKNRKIVQEKLEEYKEKGEEAYAQFKKTATEITATGKAKPKELPVKADK